MKKIDFTITHRFNEVSITEKEFKNLLSISCWNCIPYFPNRGRSAGVVSGNDNETTGSVPLTVHFTPANIQNENDITGWRWDFGDGRSSTEKSPVHTFYLDDDLNDPSVYTVSLTVYGFNGTSHKETKPGYITLYSFKYANFNAINTLGPEDLRVKFYSQYIGFGSNATGLQNASDYIVSTWSERLNMEFFYAESGTVVIPKNATTLVLANEYVDDITITVLPQDVFPVMSSQMARPWPI
ncbi:surface layer protein [Candidatus Magnetomorum sp. HK-1]|nr:surface layer protein [Candidatus Magnetomorum sp. HK-1]